MQKPTLPNAPKSILKGISLGCLLDAEAVICLAKNISLVYKKFNCASFIQESLKNIQPLAIMARGQHIANSLRQYLPNNYEKAVQVLLKSLTPPLQKTEGNGLAPFFYLPHISFVATFGLDAKFNDQKDPFQKSMLAQYELTKRFTAEFSLRPFLIQRPSETLAQLMLWTKDVNPHVRRLCSEGTRPRLPWAIRIPAFVKNPRPVLPILEALKDDTQIYVIRSVANHLGDIAKDNLELVLSICERWLKSASPQRKWLIRHALRYPAKQGVKEAIALRQKAK